MLEYLKNTELRWEADKIASFRSIDLVWWKQTWPALAWSNNHYLIYWVSELCNWLRWIRWFPYYERFLDWFPTVADLAQSQKIGCSRHGKVWAIIHEFGCKAYWQMNRFRWKISWWSRRNCWSVKGWSLYGWICTLVLPFESNWACSGQQCHAGAESIVEIEI